MAFLSGILGVPEVRQGDPLSLSLSLSLLTENFLSRCLTHLVNSSSLLPIFSPISMHALIHFLYDDDVFCLC